MKKAILITIAAVFSVAIYAWAQYTPKSEEDASFGSGLTASTVTATTSVSTAVMYDEASSVASLWYLAPSYFPPESFSVWLEDCYTAGYIANAADTNTAGLTVVNGIFSETADHGEWLVNLVDGGSDNGETITVADDAPSGLWKITANDAANDRIQIQKNGEAFRISTTRDLWYETSFELSDVSETEAFVGLSVADTDLSLDSLGNDFMGFVQDEGTNVAFQMAKNGTVITNAAITQVADATGTGAGLIRVGFYADGSTSNVYVYVDGAAVATNAASTSLPNDEAMSPVVQVQGTDAAADSIWVDYIKIVQTR